MVVRVVVVNIVEVLVALVVSRSAESNERSYELTECRVTVDRLTTYREADSQAGSQADRASTLMTSFRWTDPYSAFIRTFETFARRLQILADCV